MKYFKIVLSIFIYYLALILFTITPSWRISSKTFGPINATLDNKSENNYVPKSEIFINSSISKTLNNCTDLVLFEPQSTAKSPDAKGQQKLERHRFNVTRTILLCVYEEIQNKCTFPVGTFPCGIAFDGANIWVANNGSNSVTKLRASDGIVLGTYAVGFNPRGMVFDGANIWVANTNSNSVTKLRASDGTMLGTFAVGWTPQLMAFDRENIWVSNSGSGTVTKLLASDGTVLGTYAVGLNPRGVAFDGANIWVANYGSNSVTKHSLH